jgi:hypothetical protein
MTPYINVLLRLCAVTRVAIFCNPLLKYLQGITTKHFSNYFIIIIIIIIHRVTYSLSRRNGTAWIPSAVALMPDNDALISTHKQSA